MKYIIYCGPGIGDLVLILPMVRAIKKHDSNAYIQAFMSSSSKRININKLMFQLQNKLDDIDYYSMRELIHTGSFLMRLGYKKYDYGFALQYTDNANTSIWPCKILNYAAKITCGITNHFNKQIKYNLSIDRIAGYQIADYPILMLKKLGIPAMKECDSLFSADILTSQLEAYDLNGWKDRPGVVLCMGTASVGMKIGKQAYKNDAKNWPYQYWVELAKRISNDGTSVLLLGGPKEKQELIGIIPEELPANIYNCVGRCSIVESVALMSIAKLVIGADTGLMHCAGALDLMSLTLFGCTDFREYLPFGNHSHYLTSNEKCSPCFGTEQSVLCKMIHCMKNLTVDTVYEKAKELMFKE